MGDLLSTPSQSNPSSSPTAMPTSNSTQNHQPESEQTQNPQIAESETLIEESSDPPIESKDSGESIEESSDPPTESKDSGDPIEERDEEEGECGFCLFMKGGGCKDTFTDWENCVEEGEKNKEDIVEKCFQATSALKKCMEAHSDYYGPLLQAEKDMEEEAKMQLEQEKEKEQGGVDVKEEPLNDSEKIQLEQENGSEVKEQGDVDEKEKALDDSEKV